MRSILLSLSLFGLVLLLSGVSAHEESVKNFLERFSKNPSALLQDRAHRGATVLFGQDGSQAPLAKLAHKMGEHLEIPMGGWDIEVDSRGKMAWFSQEASEGFAAHGGVLVNAAGNWQILQLNVTGSFADHSKRQLAMPRKSVDLTVMTFNLRYGSAPDGNNSWYNRDHLVYQIFNDYDATLVGVQEGLLFQLGEILSNTTGYRWLGVGRDDGHEAGEFAAIFYKTAVLELLDQGTFWYCSTPDVPGCTSYGNTLPRIATWARFRHFATGETFYHYNTHLDHQSINSREKSSEQLINHIRQQTNGDSFFITGDFNCNLETSTEIMTIKNAGFDDSFRLINPNATDVGTIHYFSGTRDNTKIDYVFTPRTDEFGGRAEVHEAMIIHDNDNGQYPSDHFPVYSRFTLFSPL